MEPPPSLGTGTDAQLIARTLEGDLSAFDAIVAAQQASVRAYLRARVRDAHTADDLAQESFLVAFRRLKDFDRARPIGPWIRGIALNVLRNHRRSAAARVVVTDEIEALLAPSEDALPSLEADEAVVALKRCLETLAPDASELVSRRYAQGLSVDEICKQNGTKHSATTMALHRIRLRLKECIERRLPGERRP